MMRRTALIQIAGTLAVMALATPAISIAQRATQPIRRPRPPGRPDLPLVPGRLPQAFNNRRTGACGGRIYRKCSAGSRQYRSIA